MTRRNSILLVCATFGAALVSILVIVLVSLETGGLCHGPFNTAFSLVDDRGNHVDQSIFKGSPSLVYFGYTHCPEVCPTTLFEVAGYLKDLGTEGAPLKAYFFSVDPERDTPQVMHGYVTAFTDRITGVTGSPLEMQKVIDGWIVHAAKLPSEDDDYHMSHTMSLFMIGKDGKLKGLLPYGADQDEALNRIRSSLL